MAVFAPASERGGPIGRIGRSVENLPVVQLCLYRSCFWSCKIMFNPTLAQINYCSTKKCNFELTHVGGELLLSYSIYSMQAGTLILETAVSVWHLAVSFSESTDYTYFPGHPKGEPSNLHK